MPKTRGEVVEKGCFDAFANPKQVCKHLYEMDQTFSGYTEFSCKNYFLPSRCKLELIDLDDRWKKKLSNLKKYADEKTRAKLIWADPGAKVDENRKGK